MMIFEPWNYSTTELESLIENVDFFDDVSTFHQEVYEELQSRYFLENSEEIRAYEHIQNSVLSVDEINDEIEYLNEKSHIRSWIIKKLGTGNFQKIYKNGESSVTGDLRTLCDKISQNMSDDRHIYSHRFIIDFMKNEEFTFSDIITMLQDIPSQESTKSKIKELKELHTYAIDSIDTHCHENTIEHTTESETYEYDSFNWSTGEYSIDSDHPENDESIYFPLVACSLPLVACSLYLLACSLYLLACSLYLVACIFPLVACSLHLVACSLPLVAPKFTFSQSYMLSHIVKFPQIFQQQICKQRNPKQEKRPDFLPLYIANLVINFFCEKFQSESYKKLLTPFGKLRGICSLIRDKTCNILPSKT